MSVPGVTNWILNNTFTKQLEHRTINHIPGGELTWRIPSKAEEISWGISPAHSYLSPHDLWRVSALAATVLATGDSFPYLTVKKYGKGWFIYCAQLQPLVGHGGFAPGMYAYVFFRKAIEWAYEASNLPIPKISPWPYPYNAALMVRHDLENFTNEIAAIAASAQVEFTNGAARRLLFLHRHPARRCSCRADKRDNRGPAPGGDELRARPSDRITGASVILTIFPSIVATMIGGIGAWTRSSTLHRQIMPTAKAYAQASLSNAFSGRRIMAYRHHQWHSCLGGMLFQFDPRRLL